MIANIQGIPFVYIIAFQTICHVLTPNMQEPPWSPICRAFLSCLLSPPKQYAMSFPLICRNPIFISPSPTICYVLPPSMQEPIFILPSPTICYVPPPMQKPNIHITLPSNTECNVSFPLICWNPNIADTLSYRIKQL